MTLVLAGLVAALSAGIARLFIEPRAKQRAFGGAWLAIFAVLFFLSWLYDVIPHMTPIFEDLKVEYEKDMPLLQNPEAATGAQTRRTCEAALDRMRPGCCDTWLPARNSPDLGSVRGTAPGTHARCRT